MSVFNDPTLDPAESPPQGDSTPEQPSSEQPQSTEETLNAILAEQRAHRAEVAALRDQVNRQTNRTVAPTPAVKTAEELRQERLKEISEHDWYCPGCGRLADYPQRCTGRSEAPHPAIEMVSTDSLRGDDPSKHEAPVYVNESDRILLG